MALAKYAVQVTPGAVGWVVMFGINAIFIKHFYNTMEVGYYSAGVTLVQIFTFLPAAISAILMPKIAGLKDKSKIIRPLIFTIIGSFLISLIMLIILLNFKNFIIETVFTAKYASTAVVILPLAIGQITISLYQIYASVWHGLNKPVIPSIIIIISCIINIIGSYFLTKTFGIVGAATSNAISASIALITTMAVFQIKWKTLLKTPDLNNL
jgi:O-antigen/teichoic acid export membrane protein